MAKKNIFIDGTPLISEHLSGVGHVVLETVRALDTGEYSKKATVTVFLPIDEKGKLGRYTFKYIKIKYLPFPHKFLSLFSRLPISPPLDIFLGKGTYLFLNFRNWPLAFSESLTYIHDVAFVKYPQYIEPRNLRFLSKHAKRWMKQTDRVIAVSETTKKEIIDVFPNVSQKVEVVLNAINTHLYKLQDDKEVSKVKEKYKLQDYILFVSNIEPRKNIETLIEAFKLSSVNKEDRQLFIIGGNGWLNEPILESIKQAQAEGFKVIKNSEFVPDEDLPALMQGARSLVTPSWHEGFGLPLVQTIASGGSVIASDIPALREASKQVDANKVRFFKPSNAKELARLIDAAFSKNVPSKHGSEKELRNWNDAARDLMTVVSKLKEID